jgi:hypothetical protein
MTRLAVSTAEAVGGGDDELLVDDGTHAVAHLRPLPRPNPAPRARVHSQVLRINC